MSCPFLRNSLALRIVLLPILTAPVFWLAGCVMSPACPQAEPLPDNEAVQTCPGATPREKMIEIVLTEWDRRGCQVVRVGRDDTYRAAGGGFSDQSQGRWLTPSDPMSTPPDEGSGTDMSLPKAVTEPTAPAQAPCLCYPDGTDGEAIACGCMLAKRYWGIVGKIPTCRQLITGGRVWSAVFISWIMRKAGLQNDQFLTGATHAERVTDARDHLLRHSVFVLERTPAVSHLDDLVCTARGVDRLMTGPAEIQAGRMPIRCDLVVKTDPVRHEVKPTGGNVQQSAPMSTTELNDANRSDPHTNPVVQWLVVLRNQLPQQTADVTLFDARRKFISM